MGVRLDRSAVIERGKRDQALEFAATVSDYVGENFGVTVTWGLQVGGTLGTLHWYADYESMAQLEETLGRTMTDAQYLKLVDEAADLFAAPPEDTLVYTM
ncbi:MAG: hypothetical protein ACE5GC_01315 [Acidimicrobiia bacterium]